MRFAFILVALTAFTMSAFSALAFETNARAAYVVDLNTGMVLIDRNSDVPLPPASMSKLMTLNMLFEALEDGRVALDSRFSVSDRASSLGGSTMFLDRRDRPTVEELIKGIVVLSGNDACVVVAEGLSGTEEEFVRQMNQRAAALGMTSAKFANSSGWPHPEHRMSSRDLVFLANRIITEFPEYYGYFGMEEFMWDGRAPQNRFNRNPLLKLDIGADGLKTGHTEEAGYGLVGSAMQGDRRIVFTLAGLGSKRERAEVAERVVNWAFRHFITKDIAARDEAMAELPVWRGAQSTVRLVAPDDISILVPAGGVGDVSATLNYRTPVEAPIEKGRQLGELTVSVDGIPEHRYPLVADRDVAEGGIISRLVAATNVLFDAAWNAAFEAP
ncbi:MAG: D-alanyl-D-alanine carboxypeptidase [Rhodobacter sp.]|nr:D-alanyl-D-alanine carboxypeptidase [Rhodobacter sp.]